MHTYIVLLRGINVGGTHKIKMADLRLVLEEEGFEAVQTYIQSGNVVLKSAETDREKLARRIAVLIKSTFGFDVRILVKSSSEFQELLEHNPFEDQGYYVMLKEDPASELVKQLEGEADKYPNEKFVLTNSCVYLLPLRGLGKAKCNNNFFEKKLGVTATTRNHRTMLKLLEMARAS